MNCSSILKFGLAIAAAAAVSGCTSSGGGGGGGGGGGSVSFADFDGEFDRVNNMMPTSDMPTRLDANYQGAMRADAVDSSDGQTIEIIADLDVDIDWTDGQTSNPFSGGAKNFRGRAAGGDEIQRINGEMLVDPDIPSAITRTASTIALPTGGTQEVAVGGMMLNLTGQLEADGDTVEARVLLGGNFYGAEGRAAVGTVAGTFGDPGYQVNNPDGLITNGSFYIEAQ
jgi:hypothetical protein